jgi:hypothetical protein
MDIGMFKNIITLSFVVISIVLSGCSINHPSYGPLTFINPDRTVDMGSYVQWNDDYAVTAKHVKNVKDVVYVSNDYDLVFFKHKSTNPMKWADTQVNEPLISKGFPFFPQRDQEIAIKGNSVNIHLTLDNMPYYYLMDAQLIAGMSGGPVFNQYNEVVGINIGYTNKRYNIDNKDQVYSIYLSSQAVKNEWSKFQNSKLYTSIH